MSRWHRTEFDFLPEQAFRPRAGGGMTLEGSAKPPDMSGQNAAALGQLQLSADQLAWAKSVYADEAPAREQAQELATQVSQAQLAQMNQQTNIAQMAADDYKNTYRPLEQGIVADAQAYDTPERRAAESAAAVASVEKNLAQQRGATMREQERAGVDPSSGKTAALQGSMDLGAAKLKAGAGNQASKAVETVGYARKMDAANLGRNIASSQGTAASLAAQTGNSAVASSAAGLQAAGAGNAALAAGYSGASNGLAGAANTYGNIAQQQSAASTAKANNTNALIGSAAMAAAMFM